MHVEVRGKNKIPYLYESYRVNGKVKTRYKGKLATVLQQIKNEGGVMPGINISKYGQDADISVALADWDKQVLKQIRIAKNEVDNIERDKKKKLRNESIRVARSMYKDKIPVKRIAHELSKLNKRTIGTSTAHRWATSTKLTPEYYNESKDEGKAKFEAEMVEQKWEDEYQAGRDAWADQK